MQHQIDDLHEVVDGMYGMYWQTTYRMVAQSNNLLKMIFEAVLGPLGLIERRPNPADPKDKNSFLLVPNKARIGKLKWLLDVDFSKLEEKPDQKTEKEEKK